MPFVVLFLVMVVVLPVAIFSVKQKQAQQRAAEIRRAAELRRAETVKNNEASRRASFEAPRSVPAGAQTARPAYSPYVQPARSAEGQPMKATDRRPLEKAVMNKTIPGKPVAPADDCSGGSIHDGYHEGVTQFANNRPAAVAGNLGHRLADEDEKIAREKEAAENAKRALERISKLPPLAQGVVWAEILGKPRSEVA